MKGNGNSVDPDKAFLQDRSDLCPELSVRKHGIAIHVAVSIDNRCYG